MIAMNKTFGNAFSKNKTFALSLTVLAVLVVVFFAGALAVRNTFIHSFGVFTLGSRRACIRRWW